MSGYIFNACVLLLLLTAKKLRNPQPHILHILTFFSFVCNQFFYPPKNCPLLHNHHLPCKPHDMSESTSLKYTPLKSFVDASFFQKLSNLKLDQFKLDSSSKPIYGTVNVKSLPTNEPTALNLSASSFDLPVDESLYPAHSVLFLNGTTTNFNTIEEFKTLNKAIFLKERSELILQNIKNKSVLANPSLLNSLDVICFADLKKFKFYYWVANPILYSKWDVLTEEKKIHNVPEEILRFIEDKHQFGYFIVKDDELYPLSLLDEVSGDQIEVGFIDSCIVPRKPSKLLNNFLTALSIYGFKNVTVNVYRLAGESFQLSLENIETDPSKVSGWERTLQNKLGPKASDLSSLIDPIKLSEQSVDLNLKLMKWRIVPELDLELLKTKKFLLLGAGTLGSYVSRALLGWGVRNITFVDNGKVSFSNPVRQPLFNFEDVGKSKSAQASESLKKIFPLVNSNGHEFEIPMIGHPITQELKQSEEYKKLDTLIKEHDVIYLLTDSRETRWLPTVLGNVHSKIVINAALGFDSYLVMRHGTNGNLGCYFCNDIMAPTDSLSDRTLDQMCTVTRPGVAMLASSLAVELAVSLLQHPLQDQATTKDTTILGDLPHQLRGFLSSHEILKLETPAYEHCSACSPNVINELKTHGWEFVKKALNESKYIEVVSGLAEVHRKAEEAVAEMEQDLSDDDW